MARLGGKSDEIILTANVNGTILLIAEILNDTRNGEGRNLNAELQDFPETYREAVRLYQNKGQEDPPPFGFPAHQVMHLNEIHLALVAYAVDVVDQEGETRNVYSAFNTRTREMIVGKMARLADYNKEIPRATAAAIPYPFKSLLTRLWEATTLLQVELQAGQHLYRGVTGCTDGFVVGSNFAFPQFISTSAIRETAEEFARGQGGAIFEFVPDGQLFGVDVGPYSDYEETEILLSPLHSFRVTNVTPAGKLPKVITCTVAASVSAAEIV